MHALSTWSDRQADRPDCLSVFLPACLRVCLSIRLLIYLHFSVSQWYTQPVSSAKRGFAFPTACLFEASITSIRQKNFIPDNKITFLCFTMHQGLAGPL